MEKLQRLAISDEGFIFDPTTGNSFTTNKVGLWIMEQLKEDREISEILEDMVEQFETNQEEAQKDLMDFMEQLRACSLL